jgi:hypothetical protein
MEADMTTTRSLISLIAPALVGVALFAGSPVQAASESDGRAVAQCQAEVARHFPAGAIRSQRIASISGNSRHTRVSILVTADRRYTLECSTDADGRIATASWTPPSETRLAGAAQGNQAQ